MQPAARSAPRIGPLPPALPVAVATALVLGIFSWWADQLSWGGLLPGTWQYDAFGALQSLGNGPTLWLLAAFAVGAASRHELRGAAFATAALALAVVVYYGVIVVASSRPGAELLRAALLWVAVATVAGPSMGAAGGLWTGRRPWRWVGAAVLGGALVGMGLFLLPILPLVGVVHLLLGGLAAIFAAGGRARVGLRFVPLLVTGALGLAAWAATLAVFALMGRALGA